MGFSGFCVGATYPSRDMLVRAVTPPDAYGLVFGFVSTGFNIGASIAPIVYGMLMDHGEPREVFLLSAAVCLICISTVTFGSRAAKPASAFAAVRPLDGGGYIHLSSLCRHRYFGLDDDFAHYLSVRPGTS